MKTENLPGRLESLPEIAKFVKKAAVQAGLDDMAQFEVETAIDEAFTNIVEYGYADNPEGSIKCSCNAEPGQLTIELTDQGKPFDPTLVSDPDTTAPLKKRKTHGLGIYIMRKWMDEVNYSYDPAKGNTLRLIKRQTTDNKVFDMKGSDWNSLLQLDEKILREKHTSKQCEVIEQALEKRFPVDCSVWLSPQQYPLPGEPKVRLSTQRNTPGLVKEVLLRHEPLAARSRKTIKLDDNLLTPAQAWAFPLATKSITFGVLRLKFLSKVPPTKSFFNYLKSFVNQISLTLQNSRQEILKNWRNEQLQLVSSVSNKIATSTNAKVLFNKVAHLIRTTFDYYAVGIYTYDSATKSLNFKSSSVSHRGDKYPSQQIKADQGMIGQAASSGEVVYAPSVQYDPYYLHSPLLAKTNSEIAIPIRSQRQVLGVLDVQSQSLNAFHQIDQLMLQALADTIAIALNNISLVQSIKDQSDQLAAVVEVSKAISSVMELKPLVQKVVRLIQKHFHFPYVHLYTVHPGRRKIFFQAGSGLRSHEMKERQIAYELDSPVGLIPWAVQEKTTIRINDVDQEPRYQAADLPPYNTRSEMVVPLIFAGQVEGALDLQSDQPNAFSDQDQFILETLSASIAIAIRNAGLYRSELWRREIAESFRDIAGLISSSAMLENLLNSILSKLETSLACDASAIWLSNTPDSQNDKTSPASYNLAVAHGISKKALNKVVAENTSLTRWLEEKARLESPVLRERNSKYGPLGMALDLPSDYSNIVVPLRVDDKTVGVLSLVHHTPFRYGHEALSLATTFASYAAVAVKNTALFSKVQEQTWISTSLLQAASILQTADSIDELFAMTARITPLFTAVNRVGLYSFDPDTREYTLRAMHNLEVKKGNTVLPESKNLALLETRVSLQAKSLLHQDMAAFQWKGIQKQKEAFYILPIQTHRVLLGVMVVSYIPGKGNADWLSTEKESILQGICQQAAINLDNLQLIEYRNEQSYITEVLLQINQAVARGDSMMDSLESIIDLIPFLLGSDANILALWDEEEQLYKTVYVNGNAIEWQQEILRATVKPGQSQVIDQTRKTLQVSRGFLVTNEPVVAPHHTSKIIKFRRGMRGRPIRSYPVTYKDQFFGVLIITDSPTPKTIAEKRDQLLTEIAQQIGLVIQNDRMDRERIHQERVNSEMRFAREIQRTFLPDKLPDMPGWSFAARWESMREVSGDFYDAFVLENGHVVLVIADVADKGLAASLYMTVTRTLIRSYASEGLSPAQILRKANQQINFENATGLFVTCVVVILDPVSGEIIYANAGHHMPYLLLKNMKQIKSLAHGGIALGATDDIQVTDFRYTLKQGESLVFFTDGLTESFSERQEMYGEKRLERTLRKIKRYPAEAILSGIEDDVIAFRQGSPRLDDLTLLAVARK